MVRLRLEQVKVNMLPVETTNWILGVMAVASVIQTVTLVVLGIACVRLYRRLHATVEDLEARHVAPLRRQVDDVLTQVDGVLGEVHVIAARVGQQTARVDHAINGTIERVDETAEHLKRRVRARVSNAVGVVRGIRAVVASVLTSDSASTSSGAGRRHNVEAEVS
jgi:uncharacterized protein YoxC